MVLFCLLGKDSGEWLLIAEDRTLGIVFLSCNCILLRLVGYILLDLAKITVLFDTLLLFNPLSSRGAWTINYTSCSYFAWHFSPQALQNLPFLHLVKACL